MKILFMCLFVYCFFFFFPTEKNKHFGTDMPRGRPRDNFGLKNFGG